MNPRFPSEKRRRESRPRNGGEVGRPALSQAARMGLAVREDNFVTPLVSIYGFVVRNCGHTRAGADA